MQFSRNDFLLLVKRRSERGSDNDLEFRANWLTERAPNASSDWRRTRGRRIRSSWRGSCHAEGAPGDLDSHGRTGRMYSRGNGCARVTGDRWRLGRLASDLGPGVLFDYTGFVSDGILLALALVRDPRTLCETHGVAFGTRSARAPGFRGSSTQGSSAQ